MLMCSIVAQRAEEVRSGNQYSHMKFLDISRQGHDRTDLVPDCCGNVLCDVPPIHMDKILLLHYGYSIVFLSQLSFWHRFF